MDKLNEDRDWLCQEDIKNYLSTISVKEEWFPAYTHQIKDEETIAFHSGLVPPNFVSEMLEKSDWNCDPLYCLPAICSRYEDGKQIRVYQPFGNHSGFEPLMFERNFDGVQEKFLEVSQEFRLFHNLYPSNDNGELIYIDDNGDFSTAVKISENLIEIRKDLLMKYCAAKQMALVFFVDCFRFSRFDLEYLNKSVELRETKAECNYRYDYTLIECRDFLSLGYKSMGRVVGKKVISPPPFPKDEYKKMNEQFQSFIVDVDEEGNEIKMACGPHLARAEYLIPVVFNREVLNKYYSNPQKYSVQDGHIWCGSRWCISIDNDHDDYVVVFLGDLGRDLYEKERNHWLNHNIAPHGKTLSKTAFARSLMGEFCDSTSVELVFKRRYPAFNNAFVAKYGWNLFLPLHDDDSHCLESLFLPGNNISEFERSIKYLVKILIESINEKELIKYKIQVEPNDKGITKLKNFFEIHGIERFQQHIDFLRIIQDIRSKMEAHRKGSAYDKLKKELNLNGDNYKQIFKGYLTKAVDFLTFLEDCLVKENLPTPKSQNTGLTACLQQVKS